jgi:hypothetical protein
MKQIYKHTYKEAHTQTHAHTHTHIHTYTDTHTYTHTYTYKCTHIHRYRRTSSSRTVAILGAGAQDGVLQALVLLHGLIHLQCEHGA